MSRAYRINPRIVATLSLTACIMIAGCETGSKSTWPQFGGPNGNFKVKADGIAESWPEDGPKVLWQRSMGVGYSAIVSDGSRLYTMSRGEDELERVFALNAKTGETIWEHKYEAVPIQLDEKTKQVEDFGKAPNATPLIVGNRLYTVGFTGKLFCFNKSNGKILWSRDLFEEFGTYTRFGHSASPIRYKDTLIVLAGGGEDNGVLALDLKDGSIVWQATDFKCSYSSPILVKVEGQDHLIAYMGREVIGMSPKDGELHWRLKHENRFGTSIATPIWCPGNRLLIANGSVDSGGKLLQLSMGDNGKIGFEEIWMNKKVQSGLNQHIRIGDVVYGPAGGRKEQLVGFDLNSGEILWRERDMPGIKGVYADSKLILLDDNGNLMIAKPSREGVEITSKALLLEKPSWTCPTVTGKRAYIRDKNTIMALDLS